MLVITAGAISEATASCAGSTEPTDEIAIIGSANPTTPLANPATSMPSAASASAGAP